MTTTVEIFLKQIRDEYGREISEKWLARFPEHSSEISFTEGMRVLDEILTSTVKPIFPSFGRTDSPSGEDGTLIFEHPRPKAPSV